MKLKVKDISTSSADSCSLFFQKRGFQLVDTIEEADIVVFNGGSDIGTEIYGQDYVSSRVFNEDGDVALGSGPSLMSSRDKAEIIMYKRAKALGKFIFGVCRGAQLVNCLEGGSLWQHVNNHNSSHPILDLKTYKIHRATSVHHQMLQVPKGADIIAVASESTIKIDANGQKRVQTYGKELHDGQDPEIVWFKDARALCVQGHPEYAPDSYFADYCIDLIESLYYDNVWPPKTSTSLVAV